MATITKTPSKTWKAAIRKRGWPATIKTFRTKRDAEDWARRTEDEMVRGVYIDRADANRMLLKTAIDRYLRDISSTKKPSTASAGSISFLPAGCLHPPFCPMVGPNLVERLRPCQMVGPFTYST
ncbi:MAG: hypothetical protein O3C28_20365 [Proteobacteria bacterium]|nr:hypothetical protein [Pseudomonadota bacterium]